MIADWFTLSTFVWWTARSSSESVLTRGPLPRRAARKGHDVPHKTDPITNIRFLYVDHTVVMRIYSGDKFEDAMISPGALAMAVGDGAKIMAAVFQEQATKIGNGRK